MKQPFLHDLVCTLKAPVQWWSCADGDTTGEGAQGIYCGDDRVIAEVSLDVESHEATHIGHSAAGTRSRFHAVLRTPDEGADPVVMLTRLRHVSGAGVREQVLLESVAEARQEVSLTLLLELDATPMEMIKIGSERVAPADLPAGEHEWRWRDDATHARFHSTGKVTTDGTGISVAWTAVVEPGQRAELDWGLEIADDAAKFVEAPASFAIPEVRLPQLRRLLETSAADLRGLTLAEASDPSRRFLAAGAPWFFTLFGRDSIIAASMVATAAPDLALATVRTLAARQGRVVDIHTAEQPGKILHEVRRVALDLHDDATVLPPEYYGTVDATPLWLMLVGRLVDLGLTDEVRELMGQVVAALGWLRDYADPDGDGFIEYFDESGHGLVNQGWKDSGDSIRFADGTIADGPIVLAEVQGYAAAAARTGARLLARFGRTDEERASAGEWERYAQDMSARIRDRFWVADDDGRYPAIALDHAKRPVTGVASNMGHLLGLGVLTPDEERTVVDRLISPTMSSGFGVRTMSTTNGAYWPLRYHVGSVWSHDTAWIIAGMHRSGFLREAQILARQLLQAADGFEYRLPELFGGWSSAETPHAMPYPASCRPQAWAAAGAFVLAEVLGQA